MKILMLLGAFDLKGILGITKMNGDSWVVGKVVEVGGLLKIEHWRLVDPQPVSSSS